MMAQSLAETKPIRGGGTLHHVVGRIKAPVGLGPHSGVQRMAGMAFLIRVGSAGIVFLSQIFVARRMGEGHLDVKGIIHGRLRAETISAASHCLQA